MVSIRVLIADDSELMRRQVRTSLEPYADIEICAEAENGREAVRKAVECQPDLVVMDVSMPVMNGLEATSKIKTLRPNLPVLVFTLHDSHQLKLESEKVGADAFLLKSSAGLQLTRTIRALTRGE